MNTFIVLLVVFTMISHHYRGKYSSKYKGNILSALVLVGLIAAKIIRRAEERRSPTRRISWCSLPPNTFPGMTASRSSTMLPA